MTRVRFKVLTGESSHDLEATMNTWVDDMDERLPPKVGGPNWRMVRVSPLFIQGEILYVLVQYEVVGV